jgi:competence protein ComEA
MQSPLDRPTTPPRDAPTGGLIPPTPGGLTVLTLLTAAGLLVLLGWLVLRPVPLVDFRRPPPAAIRFSLDINTAPAQELALLPGIGPAMAERIIADRRERGPFKSVDDVARVPGIGPVTLEQIRSSIRPLPHGQEPKNLLPSPTAPEPH